MSRPRIENYVRMVAKAAWSAWYKLPPQPRAWMDVDDLIHDGILYAKFYVIPNYRPHRAKFTTILTIALDNFYKGLLAQHFTHMRYDCQTVSISVVQCQLTEHDSLESEIHAVEALRRIAGAASPLLRRYLDQWVFARQKVHSHSMRFVLARDEMRELAKKYNFTRDDLAFLLQNETWRHRIPTMRSIRSLNRAS